MVLAIIVSLTAVAQVSKDSLKKVWNNQSIADTIRWQTKFEYHKEQSFRNSDSALAGFRELLVLANSIGGKYIPWSYQGFGIIFNTKSQKAEDQDQG